MYISTGVSILQENLNYSPALCVVYKILPQLQKLLVHFNQGYRSVFDMSGGGEWFCVVHRGASEGGSSEAGKFCIFETGIVQFDEYFWEQIYSRWWWVKKKQFYKSDWPKFCILWVILVKIVSKNWKSAMFWPKSVDLGWKSDYFHLDAQQWRMIAIPSHWSNILRVYPPSPWDL